MNSTFQFVLKYSGKYIAELGHPWEITEFRKIDEVKMLVWFVIIYLNVMFWLVNEIYLWIY